MALAPCTFCTLALVPSEGHGSQPAGAERDLQMVHTQSASSHLIMQRVTLQGGSEVSIFDYSCGPRNATPLNTDIKQGSVLQCQFSLLRFLTLKFSVLLPKLIP
jgi:hypothetical protein